MFLERLVYTRFKKIILNLLKSNTNSPLLGGGDRIRTDDPMLAEHVLSQLSYTPSPPLGGGKRVRTDDLMLAKHALSQLSYTPSLWWAREDLNLRPHAYQACALTS